MAYHDEDDLFKDTSMTFGEHLDELRVALFKALASLVIGFVIGLVVAPWVVQWVQSPLINALHDYYSQEAVEYLQAHLPANLQDEASFKKYRDLVLVEGLVPHEEFVAPAQLLEVLRDKYPKALNEVELPKPDADRAMSKQDLSPVLWWSKLSEDDRLKPVSMNVQESFMIYIKAALLAGAILAAPFVFYFLWTFVAAGLYPHEKHYVRVFLPFSLGLFMAGALLAFVFVFPPVLKFFFGITKSMNQGFEPRISEWLHFVLLLPLGFGVSFQLPLLMLFLERIQIFTVEAYISKWKVAVLIMAIAAMVLSPGGDPNSMLMMLFPLIALYFGGIALCKWLPSRRRSGLPAKPKEKALASVD